MSVPQNDIIHHARDRCQKHNPPCSEAPMAIPQPRWRMLAETSCEVITAIITDYSLHNKEPHGPHAKGLRARHIAAAKNRDTEQTCLSVTREHSITVIIALLCSLIALVGTGGRTTSSHSQETGVPFIVGKKRAYAAHATHSQAIL